MNTPRLETVRTVIRETAIDAMPELAPRLESDPMVIQRHLMRELGITATARELTLINAWPLDGSDASPIRDLEPTGLEREHAATLTKYERYTLAQSVTWRQANLMLDERPEDPADAVYADSRFVPATGTTLDHYEVDHDTTFYNTADEIFDTYTWAERADKRYMLLSWPFTELRPFTPDAHPEPPSLILGSAMSAAGVRQHTTDASEWLGKHRNTWNLPPEERTKIAHDLAYLGLVFASQHFETLGNSSITKLNGDIKQLDNGRWIYVRGTPRADPHYYEITRRAQWYAPTLKCPVHQPTRKEPTSELSYYIHASIQAAKDYDLYQ